MHIKHFTSVAQVVPHPMRPGERVKIFRLVDAHCASLTHEGVHYEPDAKGWFNVPEEVGQRLCRYRANRSGFYHVGEVADAVRMGSIEEFDQPVEATANVRSTEEARPKRGKSDT